MSAAQAALGDLLAKLGAESPDEALVEYMASLLEDADDDTDSEALLEQLRELLAEVAPRFAATPAAQQTDLVLELFQAARPRGDSSTGASQLGAAQDGASCSASDELSAAALVASLRQLQMQEEEASTSGGGGGASGRPRSGGSQIARMSSGGGGGSSGGSDEPGCDLENADPSAIAALRELCSCAVSDEFLAAVLLRKHSGDAEAAAVWLVEQEDIAAAEAAWKQQQAEEREEAMRLERERQKSKAAVLARFDLQAVPEVVDGKKKQQPVLEAWNAGKQQKPTTKVRYREGAVVTSSGEKYVTIKTTPDWDGGSRGKVYTKGKRGKGFV